MSGVEAMVKDFEWSIQPLTFWMRLIGIPLRFSTCSLILRLLLFGFGLFMIISDMLANFCLVYMDGQMYVGHSGSTFEWNATIHRMNHVLVTLGSHLALLITTTVRWPALIKILRELETNFIVQKEFETFRKLFLLGLAVIIVVGIITSY